MYFNNTIHFAGHSLGGANAQMFGTYYAFRNGAVKTYITTGGAPRQGNYAYKVLGESLPNLSVWRIVNCRDMVPRLPNINYYHAGHMMWRRCSGAFEEDLPNDVVEAYYRHTGDEDQGYAEVPTSYGLPRLVWSDHGFDVHLEWLNFAKESTSGKNWTSTFETTGTSPPPDQSGDKIVAANIQLPSPPLPLNQFADQPLDPALAHEMIRLSELAYEVNGMSDASILPDGYTLHSFVDTGSTEVMVVSTNHENEDDPADGEKGKIIVVFKGADQTDDGDWMTNLDRFEVRYGPDDALLDGSVVTTNSFGFPNTRMVRILTCTYW